MASSSKSLGPYKISPEELEEQRRQLRCINRRCRYGDVLLDAVALVCSYYDVDYKPGREVCSTCLAKCLRHYKYLELKWKEGKCVMDSSFPSYDSYLVIDDSSCEENDEPEHPKPSTSKEGLPPDQEVKKAIDSAIVHYFDKNKYLFEHQVKLCDEYMTQGIKKCLIEADAIDKIAAQLEDEMKSLRNEIYDPYQPIITSLDPVEINDLEESTDEEYEDLEAPNNEFQLPVEELTTAKEAKRIKLDNSDKEDIISIRRTYCPIPSNIPMEGPLDYPPLENEQIVYAMKLTLMHPWYRCKIKTLINSDYVHVKFDSDEKLVTTKQVAFSTLNTVRFPVGCRIIAKYSDPYFRHVDEFYAGIIAEPPKMLNDFRYLIFFDHGYVQYRKHQDIRLIARKSNQVWNDVHPNSGEFIRSYLEKYPERQMVKLTKQHSVRAEHDNQWQMAKVLDVDSSLVKLYFPDYKHSEWIYRGSSRLYNIFEKQTKSERGIRLRQSGLAYLNKPFVEFTSVEEEPCRNSSKYGIIRKSTSKLTTQEDENTGDGFDVNTKCIKKTNTFKIIDIILPKNIPNPLKFIKHKCNPSCVEWTAYNYERTRQISMLSIPLHFGFVRYLTLFNNSQKYILYRTPCGVTIRNMKQMLEYLIITKSKMTIDQFDFNSWVKPFSEFKIIKYVQFLKDISEGKEFRGITCVNTINNILPPKMDYITTRQAMPGVNINVDTDFLCGCDCTDDCQDKSKCACWQMTIDGQKILPNLYKDPNIGYSYRRLPERVLTGIYECNKTCKCSSSCLNRVVQNPLSQKLQLFMTEKKGWGVRCLNDIPQGSFICIYVGSLLTETDANEGGKNYGDEYLAELDYIEVVEKIKEDYESDISYSDHENDLEKNQSESSDEQYPSTSDGKRTEMTLRLRKRKKSKTKKDNKHVHVPSKLNARDMKNNPEPPKSMREYFGNNESVYIMDAKTNGNIGRYLNHSCSPNTFVQNVFVDTHDLRFPWVSFFALHYIQAGTELTWDYSYDIGSVPGKKMKCHCESVYCRGRLL
ncbi:histone-lysine N-methyltransferase eggless-like [Melanaphis sacchari]|uniref:Histone-lysine N-methyltransferase eggless n=1 Tax=Melanaphis sacchari TaxID=742174 RepID=A0A2H8TPV0_9HEMI|nr:histone-lysine N-methyltransferase eggless-like [Melanaphis sacchari]XP_025204090.1 histone-lysine N-methyltransferase eggless-like [Melanaphis sacchari]